MYKHREGGEIRTIIATLAYLRMDRRNKNGNRNSDKREREEAHNIESGREN